MDLFWAKNNFFGSGLFNVFPTFLDLSQFHACFGKENSSAFVEFYLLKQCLVIKQWDDNFWEVKIICDKLSKMLFQTWKDHQKETLSNTKLIYTEEYC